MSDSVPIALRKRFDLGALERDESTIVALDARGEIRWANAAWRRFAVENGAPDLPARFDVGASYFEGVSGDLKRYYERTLQQCLRSGRPFERKYECSSPEARRLFRLRMLPLAPDLALLVHSLRVVEAHAPSGFAPDERVYRDAHGLITQCSNCRRVRRPGHDAWDWVSAWVRAQPERVSHGLCATCMGYHYGDLDV